MDFLTPVLIMILISGLLGLILFLSDILLMQYKEYDVKINDDKVLKITGGIPLIKALGLNKIYLPSSCGGKGTCGYCKIKITKGSEDIFPTEKAALTRQEIKEGYRLACQIKVKKDIDLVIPQDILSAVIFNSRVEIISDISDDLRQIRLKLLEPDQINFKPGQYIQFFVPSTDESRAYSIVSTPSNKGYIDLLIKYVEGGLCSSYIHKDLELDDLIQITGPHGNFYFDETSMDTIVLIAGGCGIAPIRCIINYIFERKLKRKIIYFFGARNKKDLYFYNEYLELSKSTDDFIFIPALSIPLQNDQWDGNTGFIHELVDKYDFKEGSHTFYLCGPDAMIEAVTNVLLNKEISMEKIFYDKI